MMQRQPPQQRYGKFDNTIVVITTLFCIGFVIRVIIGF